MRDADEDDARSSLTECPGLIEVGTDGYICRVCSRSFYFTDRPYQHECDAAISRQRRIDAEARRRALFDEVHAEPPPINALIVGIVGSAAAAFAVLALSYLLAK